MCLDITVLKIMVLAFVVLKIKKMKKYFCTLLAFLPLTLFCANSDSTKTRKIEIGITYSPDYCYRTLKPDASSKWITDIRDTLEIPKLGYTLGANVVYHLNKKISIESGLLFSDKGDKTKKYVLENSPTGELPINNTFIYHYFYLDIPLKANYYILTGKVKLFLTAGISTNVFLTKKEISILGYSNMDTKKNSSTVNSEYSRFNFAVIAGFGMNCKMANKLNLKLEPIYRRSITSITSNTPIKEYLYSIGLNVGIYYNL